MSERVAVVLQLLAFASVVYGVALVFVPAAFIVGGLLVVLIVERI